MTNPRVPGAVVILALLATTLTAPAKAQDTAGDRFIAEGDVVRALGDGAEPLDLDTSIDVALRSNQGLQQEREGLSELEARKVQARSEGFPVVELQGAWSRSRDPSFALDESFGGGGEGDDFFSSLFPDTVDVAEFSFIPDPADIPAQTFWRTYLDAYWELRPTRVWRAVSAAEGAIEQQAALVRDAEHRTVEAVVGAYHAIVLARERLAAIEREIDAREEFLEVTRRRFRLEFATPLDTLQAAVSLANLRPEARRRANDLRRAGQQLNLLLGRDPLTPVSVVASFPLEDGVVPVETALELARERPDLQAQRRQSSLYELRRGVADAQNHPYLTVEGQWGFVTRELEDLTNDGQDFWRAGLTLHLPLFDGLRSRGEMQEAEALLRRNQARVDELEAQVRDEVLDALETLEIARADLTAASLNLDRANDAYTQISLRYELGKADNLEVLNAQAERFTARSTVIQARYDVLTSLATLKRAMGVSPALPLASILAADGGATTTAQEDSR
jgi:outer membrane protein TolC